MELKVPQLTIQLPTSPAPPVTPTSKAITATFVRSFGADKLRKPHDIAVTAGGTIYVVHEQGIAVFDDNFTFQRSLVPSGKEQGHLFKARGIAIDKKGDIFTTEGLLASSHHRMQVFQPDGTLVRCFGTKGVNPGEFDQPTGVAVADDTMYVCDSGHQRVQVFDSEGKFQRAFGKYGYKDGEFNYPLCVAVSPSMDRVVISDFGWSRLQVSFCDFLCIS